MKPRRAPLTKRCVAVGCQRLIPNGRVMCIEHWRMVPRDLARQVIQTRAYGSPEDGDALLGRAVAAVHQKDLARQEREARRGDVLDI